MHRHMIVRTFPARALEGLDEEAKQNVNAKNAAIGVRWIRSYANADLTKTFCIYEGPGTRSRQLPRLRPTTVGCNNPDDTPQ